MKLRYFFDTEFIENGVTIDLISIGIVCEDGRGLYLESQDVDLSRANSWVQENVIPHLQGGRALVSRRYMAETIRRFCGTSTSSPPEFWAYYADYDWVALCQLFGTMMDLPNGWPMYCRDLKQIVDMFQASALLPKQIETEHHALADARWNYDAWCAVRGYARIEYGDDVIRSWGLL